MLHHSVRRNSRTRIIQTCANSFPSLSGGMVAPDCDSHRRAVWNPSFCLHSGLRPSQRSRRREIASRPDRQLPAPCRTLDASSIIPVSRLLLSLILSCVILRSVVIALLHLRHIFRNLWASLSPVSSLQRFLISRMRMRFDHSFSVKRFVGYCRYYRIAFLFRNRLLFWNSPIVLPERVCCYRK
jgi:hypothetical protein